jgi:hypothetical protein
MGAKPMGSGDFLNTWVLVDVVEFQVDILKGYIIDQDLVTSLGFFQIGHLMESHIAN